jgi:ABC-type nitrate/sulfonate/bicarbonate transport system permease component
LPLIIVVAALGLWEGLVRGLRVPDWLLPAPSDIGLELYSSSRLLWRHTVVTLEEVLIGFALALGVGVLLAVAIAYSRLMERSIYPFVIASQTIPIIAIAPLLLIWLGYNLTPKIIVVALVSFFPIVVNMVDGLKAVDSDMVRMMRTLGASRWQVFVKLQVPSSLPFLFSGTKIAIAVSVIGAVIGEWVGARAGLGYLMTVSVPYFLTARVFAAIFILSVMGIALFLIVASLERLLLPWHHGQGRQAATVAPS